MVNSLKTKVVSEKIQQIGIAIRKSDKKLISALKHFSAYPINPEELKSISYQKFQDFSKFATDYYSKVRDDD